ncbi:MAG: hypothetical protein PSX81_15290 [bacterium]|nr:hypothetical protein [bacterium]
MKNLRLFNSVFLGVFISVSAFAQREFSSVTRNNPYDKMVHFVPLPLLVGGFEMGYEKATTHKESFYLQVGYYTAKNPGLYKLKNDGYSDMNGLKLECQYRFFRKTNNYIKNVWIGPFVNFKTLSMKYTETTYTTTYNPYNVKTNTINENRMATSLAFGYMMGLRKSVFENIYLDLSLGGGVYIPVAGSNHEQLNIGLISPYQRGVQLRMNLGFCIAL